MQRLAFGLVVTYLAMGGSTVFAQEEEAAEESAEEDPVVVAAAAAAAAKNRALTVLDDSPWVSTRASGMSGALSTLADAEDAPYYNPAGIGGIGWERGKPPRPRSLHFPYLGMSANPAATSLYKKFADQDADNNKSVGSAIIDAHKGERQYARLSTLISMGFGRTILVPFNDYQVAAVPKGDGTDLITTRYRQQSGVGAGLSFTDPKERLYLGFYSQFAQRQELFGDYAYSNISGRESRSETLSANTNSYTGVASNVGLLWRINQKLRPTLGIVVRDVGATTYNSDKSGVPPVVTDEDLTIGFSISPDVGSIGRFNAVVEGTRLSSENVAVNKKFRTAVEFQLGRVFNSYAVLSLRAGYNLAGPSAGFALNLGLLHADAAIVSQDIGEGNKHLAETRYSAVFGTNLAEF